MSDIGTPEPSWNPDAHLERVYRRGRRLRTRRRVGVVAGGSLVVAALLAVGVTLGGGGADHGRRVATGASGTSGTTATTGSSGSSGPAIPGGSGGDGVGAGGGGSGSSSTVTARPGTPGGAGGGVTPTSAAHHVTTNTTSATTVPGARTTTTKAATTTTGPAADCGPSDLAYSTVTDRNSYAVGDAVDINLVLRNVSGRTCTAPSIAGIGAKATITGSGTPVTTTGPAIACTATCASPVLAPGQSTAYSAGSWDSTRRGTYQVVASRLGRTGTAASFRVV